MNKKEIVNSFSNGNFKANYPHLSTSLVWEIIGEGQNIISGKESVIEYCTQITKYFESVKTEFKTIKIIEENGIVVINGTAIFIKENEIINATKSCDIYEFNNEGKIERITSYCIAKR